MSAALYSLIQWSSIWSSELLKVNVPANVMYALGTVKTCAGGLGVIMIVVELVGELSIIDE